MTDAEFEAEVRRTADVYGLSLEAAANVVLTEAGISAGDVRWADDAGEPVPPPSDSDDSIPVPPDA